MRNNYPYNEYNENNQEPLEVQWQAPNHDYHGQHTPYYNTDPQQNMPNPTSDGDGSEPPKPPKQPIKLWVKIASCAAACLVVSASSIGAFVALVNSGAIPFSSTSSNNTNPAFSITKVEGDNASQASTITGKLTVEEVAKKVIPSVVCIQAYSSTSSGQGYYSGDTNLYKSDEGSGIISTSDGYIITNAHVIQKATSIKVILHDGTTHEATLVGSDTATDLALLKIEATDLQAAEFGSSDDLNVGEQAVAIGNPGGIRFNSSVTVGYVSALNRSITYNGYDMECIQTDAAINPGNSGGALVNMYGQVIGINSAKITASGFEGLGFAIPINSAQPIISNLKQYGYVKDRAMLGISGQYINSTTASFYGLTQGYNIIKLNSNVSNAGIQVGDIITKVDGSPLESATSLQNIINRKKPGETVTLDVYRPNTRESFTATVTLTEYTPIE